MRPKSLLAGLSTLALMVLMSGAASAVPLVGGLTLTQGDKTFDAFSCTITSSDPSNPTGTTTPDACASIDVSASGTGTAADPVTLTFASGFTAAGTIIQAFEDVLIQYTVATSGGNEITAIDLGMNQPVFLGLNIASVSETVFQGSGIAGPIIGTTTVQCSNLFGACTVPPNALQSLVSLAAPAILATIVKDINLTNLIAPAAVTVSQVTQSFHQISTVPEPISMALFGTGLFGLGFLRREVALHRDAVGIVVEQLRHVQPRQDALIELDPVAFEVCPHVL